MVRKNKHGKLWLQNITRAWIKSLVRVTSYLWEKIFLSSIIVQAIFGLMHKPASWSEVLGNLLIPLWKPQPTFCEEMWPMATQWHWGLSKVVVCSNGFQVIVVTDIHIINIITITSTIFGQDFRNSAVIIVINCHE